MKKFFALIGVLFLLTTLGVSQDYFIPLDRNKTEAEVLNNTTNNLNMLFSLSGISGKDITSKDGQAFTELYFGNGYYTGQVGNPKIPAFKRLVQIPFGADVELKVTGYSKKQMSLKDIGINNPIYPVQPSLRKDKTIDEVPFEYNQKAYKTAGFSNESIAKVEILGTMRGVRIARVEVAPVQYDPVNGDVIIYNDIEVELVYKGADKEKTQSVYKNTYSPYFDHVYNTLANPYTKNVFDDHPDLTSYPVHMLIVSDRMFEETLQPYIDWKTKKGFHVEVAYTDDIGSTSNAVKDYVHAAYNDATADNPAPTFLVIAGDVAQVPASETGSESAKLTDLYYASVDGDYFPEMYYGRLSAQTTQQLENIINKILYYEQYQFEDPTYLDNATLIAGVDGNWNPKVGEPTIKYGTENYFNADNGFNTVWGYGIADDPNNPNNSSGYTGCYEDEKIAVSLINYTAHCMETVWGDPQLTISDINSMTNTGKYPLSIGNCCLSAEFGTDECVGEAWIRAQDKGAVTYIGSSPSSYWFEDFYWSVGAFPISGTNDGYVPTFEETTFGVYDAPYHSNYVTAGGLVFVGNLAVTEVDLEGYEIDSSPTYYWQAYNVLGDPSLMPYLTQGENNDVSHMDIMPIGLGSYVVTAEPGSYVAISKDGTLHGAALVDETGEVEVQIEPVLEGGDVDIVVTRPQTIPYVVQVPAAALEGPYIALDDYSINDESGNDNALVDYGEDFSLDVTLKNVGADDAQGITATLSGTDEYITLETTEEVTFGDISAGETDNFVSYNNAYSFTVSDDVPDQHEATFVLNITDGNDVWESNVKIKANAPVLQLSVSNISDDPEDISFSSTPVVSIDNGQEYNYTIEVSEMLGNGNGVLDGDEIVCIEIQTANNGNSDLKNAQLSLSSNSEYVTIKTNEVYVNSIPVGDEIPNEFTIEVHENTPIGADIDFDFSIVYAGYEENITISLPVGLQIEDFETGDFTAYPWQISGDADWVVQESEVHEGT
ncbi:MAG: C25 family cysteine peptidase, partial [Perlabentimonas sp.]